MLIPNARQDKSGNKVVTVCAPRNMVAYIEDDCMDEIVRVVNGKLQSGELMRDFHAAIVSKEIPASWVSVLRGAFFLMGVGLVRAVVDIQVKAEVERFREILPENLRLKCAIDFSFLGGIRYKVIACGKSYEMEGDPVVSLTPILGPADLGNEEVIEKVAKYIISKASNEYLEKGFSKDPEVIETGLGLIQRYVPYEEAGHLRDNVQIRFTAREIWIDNQGTTYDHNYLSRFAGCARYVLLMPFFILNGLEVDDFRRIAYKEVPFDEYNPDVERQLEELESKMFRVAFSIWMPKSFMVCMIEDALKDQGLRFLRPYGYRPHAAARLMHLAEKMKADYGIPIFRMKTRAIHLGYTAANGITRSTSRRTRDGNLQGSTRMMASPGPIRKSAMISTG